MEHKGRVSRILNAVYKYLEQNPDVDRSILDINKEAFGFVMKELKGTEHPNVIKQVISLEFSI